MNININNFFWWRKISKNLYKCNGCSNDWIYKKSTVNNNKILINNQMFSMQSNIKLRICFVKQNV